MLRKLFFDYLQLNCKYNDKRTRTENTTNNIQDVKYGKPHCVKRKKRLFHNKHSMYDYVIIPVLMEILLKVKAI